MNSLGALDLQIKMYVFPIVVAFCSLFGIFILKNLRHYNALHVKGANSYQHQQIHIYTNVFRSLNALKD